MECRVNKITWGIDRSVRYCCSADRSGFSRRIPDFHERDRAVDLTAQNTYTGIAGGYGLVIDMVKSG